MIASHKQQIKNSYFNNNPFYQQDLPLDQQSASTLKREGSSVESKPERPKILSNTEFNELSDEEAIDEIYNLLSATYDQLIHLTGVMSK
ncbi:hypothetical protein K7432_006813 [Basidiobolus ranarum]|uniref:Uncharacterized protein n=1 Tax=Basidiobolus ranarum TaxID=34480 RepID=A0ABR2WUD3_9FUNG